jgi:hypothetical protein
MHALGWAAMLLSWAVCEDLLGGGSKSTLGQSPGLCVSLTGEEARSGVAAKMCTGTRCGNWKGLLTQRLLHTPLLDGMGSAWMVGVSSTSYNLLSIQVVASCPPHALFCCCRSFSLYCDLTSKFAGLQEYQKEAMAPDSKWHEDLLEEGPKKGIDLFKNIHTFRPPPHICLTMHSPLHLLPDCPLPLKPSEVAAKKLKNNPVYFLHTFTFSGVDGADREAGVAAGKFSPTLGFLSKRQLPDVGSFPVFPERPQSMQDKPKQESCSLVGLGCEEISQGTILEVYAHGRMQVA